MQEALLEGQAAQEELELTRKVLAFALCHLPKKQLKLTLTDQANLRKLDVQMKQESKSGAIVFRVVKV